MVRRTRAEREGAEAGEGAGGGWTSIGVSKAVKDALDEVLFDMRKRSYNAVLTELIRLYWVGHVADEITGPAKATGGSTKDKSRPE